MIAAAKGWKIFDVQSTLSGNLPLSGALVLSRSVLAYQKRAPLVGSRGLPFQGADGRCLTTGV